MALNIFCRLYHRIFLGKIGLERLNKGQRELTEMNTVKHAKIFLLMLLIIPYTYYTITNYYYNSDSNTNLTSF